MRFLHFTSCATKEVLTLINVNTARRQPSRLEGSLLESRISVPLYPSDCVKEDGNHIQLTEPLEHDDTDNKQGTGAAAPVITYRWKTLMTAATTLLTYAFLYAGISMIVLLYPIEVSCIKCTSNYSLILIPYTEE